MNTFTAELAAAYVAATQGCEPSFPQAERTAAAAAGLSATLAVTAAESLFDSEPEHLQATLIALSDDTDAHA